MADRETPLPPRRWEDVGTVDGAFDEDRRKDVDVIRSDAACAFAWVTDGFQAVQVFLDPALVDRSGEICAMVETVSTANRTIETLSEAVLDYSRREGLSASIYEGPEDDLSVGTVAIAFTLG